MIYITHNSLHSDNIFNHIYCYYTTDINTIERVMGIFYLFTEQKI